MNGVFMKTLTGLIAAGSVLATAASAQTIAIMDGTVHTVSGGVIENGDVIIRDGRIAQVGADLSAPSGATVIDASGKIVTPGLIAPYTNIGLVEIGLDNEANDSSPQEGFPLGAALNAVDAFNPDSTVIPVNRASGVTRALSAPNSGDTLFGGKAALVDLSGAPGSVMRADLAQTAAMGYGGASRTGDTRMGAWAVMREYLDEARSYQANPNDYVRRPRSDRMMLSDIKALVPVVSGEQPLLVAIDGAADIRTLIRLKNTYRLRVIILGALEGWRVADELAAANIPVIVSGTANLPDQFEELSATLQNAARLHEAGVQIAFYETNDTTHNARLIRQHAGNAVAEGLPYDAAIAALTLNAARMLGVADQLGSLQPGRVADVVIWDGDPLEVTTVPEAVFIDGRPQDLNNRQRMLMERYRDLDRGDLPHAYRGGE
ncbi:amidohydrolase family protein [Hyphococcus flavus]|uniref:Amidohydrolase family protein n=1 Tax=Hyphococcus flavus TaxID=1866326 RepID=A0AAE9ZG41_9PROT|nr:amidohydrolase family protein [Hyphococcus flavus]WDI32313.1 amidohydrolase family protein [Hyphococcus flavus]